MVLASNNTATATSSPATTATTIVSCDTGTIFAEAAKKYKKDSRKSTGALKEFWDLAFEEGRRAELSREGRRQEEEEERIRLAVKKAKREVEEEMRRMYEAIPECAKEHTIRTVFGNGPIFLDPSTSHDRMRQIADEFNMDVVAASKPSAIIHDVVPAQSESTAPVFNWANDALSIPIPTDKSTIPLRDTSVLRSTALKPFGSLQQRANRRQKGYGRPRYGHFAPVSSQPVPKTGPVKFYRVPMDKTAEFLASHPDFYAVDQPLISHAAGHTRSRLRSTPVGVDIPLDWESDPRLVELSRVLRSLGWVRAS